MKTSKDQRSMEENKVQNSMETGEIVLDHNTLFIK